MGFVKHKARSWWYFETSAKKFDQTVERAMKEVSNLFLSTGECQLFAGLEYQEYILSNIKRLADDVLKQVSKNFDQVWE